MLVTAMAGRADNFARPMLAVMAVAVVVACAWAAPASAAGTEFRGVQLHSLWGGSSSEVMDRELDLAAAAGSNVVRVDVGWDSLETGGKGRYSQWYLDKLDRLVEGAQARQMRVIATLAYTPCWASSAPEALKQSCAGSWWDRDVELYPPTRASDYGDAARFITARYGTKLAALEVWNEPNLKEDRFIIAPDKPAAYATILKAAYPAAKQGNPQVPVLAGALAYVKSDFLARLYANGIKGSYDGLSIHPYNDAAPTAGNWPGIKWARDFQQAAGDDKPLWLTEFGLSTCKIGSGWCKTPEVQATNTKASFQAIAADPQIKAAVVYNLRDKGTDPNSMEDNFGLVKRDFTPKPAYTALRAALTASGEPVPPPPAGPPPPVAPPADRPPSIPSPPPAGPVKPPPSTPAPRTNPSSATTKPSAAGEPVKLYLTGAAERRRTLSVQGHVRGRSTGTISVTAFYAAKGRRFRRVATRKAPFRSGRFKARIAPFRHGRWKVQAVLAGPRSAVDAQKFRLEGGGGAKLNPPAGGAEAPPGLVGEAQLGTSVGPGPLAGGAYIGRGSDASPGKVRELQSALSGGGFESSVDGEFGSQTEAAVTRFQRAKGLLVDGVVGRQTMAALEEYDGGS